MTENSIQPQSKPTFLGQDRWWHLSFGSIMLIVLIGFLIWAKAYIPGDNHSFLLITAILLGVFMAFNIGGNDVANSFGTSVGAGTLTMKQALLIAAVFEVAGAVIAGGDVTETVRSGIVNLEAITVNPMDFVYIMMAALFGAAIWLLIATKFGLPVSTTHSIIGAIVGASLTVGLLSGNGDPLAMVQWDQIGQIAASWILSPLLGGIIAYFLFGFIKRHILLYNEKADRRLSQLKQDFIDQSGATDEDVDRIGLIQLSAYANARLPKEESNALAREARAALAMGDDPSAEAKFDHALRQLDKGVSEVQAHRALTVWVPLIAAIGSMIITGMLLVKGLKNLHLEFTTVQTVFILLMIGTLVWFAMSIFASTLKGKNLSRATFILFSWMQVFTAAAFAFSHGSNDIANAIGPFAAVLDVLKTGEVSEAAVVPGVVLFAFGVALVVGLWFIGRNVIRTVGTSLTKMHPSSGYAAELAAAMTVMLASQLGLPVSSTHILIGAVLGVGMVNRAANWKMMRPIGLAWVITLPVAAIIGALGVIAIRAIF
ncbi:inorganic phosphate transporter [Leucobacter sp. OH1287]|uniref:inorganic phosphate transporter n=1 Tax=Leucobacter sp. OH1287 TaxID=2491049 RepID=UPI000F5F5C51|nr:inorganic phosphate transporter [Leucobacter sp. OH1287]RRD60462.1 inorganic phosphate transporter [Leucobacter sp. OH1287]